MLKLSERKRVELCAAANDRIEKLIRRNSPGDNEAIGDLEAILIAIDDESEHDAAYTIVDAKQVEKTIMTLWARCDAAEKHCIALNEFLARMQRDLGRFIDYGDDDPSNTD